MEATAVNILGAPLSAGRLEAQVAASTSAWHGLLPDGTLLKAAAPAGAAPANTGSTCSSTATAVSRMQPVRARTILHPNGALSQQRHMELPLPGAADGVQQVAGWLRTTPQGEQTWVTDPAALQDLREGLAKAAQEAAAAAAAAAAEAAAAAAAAAETTGKKGSKGDKKGLGKQGSSKTGKQQPLDQAASASATAGAAGEVGGSGTAPESDTPRVALAVDAALQELEQRPPQNMGSIKAVQLTDADTRAVVTTREDHLLIVDYPDGSRLLQVGLVQGSHSHIWECCILNAAAVVWFAWQQVGVRGSEKPMPMLAVQRLRHHGHCEHAGLPSNAFAVQIPLQSAAHDQESVLVAVPMCRMPKAAASALCRAPGCLRPQASLLSRVMTRESACSRAQVG